MSDQIKSPTWFIIVCLIALLWNLMGVWAYISQITMDVTALEAMPEAERLMFENFPLWANIAFALAVFGGALGCLGLLLKKTWALPVLIVSLFGIVVQMIYNIFISGAMEVYGPGGMVMPIMILIVGLLLIFLARKAISNRWIV